MPGLNPSADHPSLPRLRCGYGDLNRYFGLGGIAGLLMLPFMFGLDPIYGLALMIGLVAAGAYI